MKKILILVAALGLTIGGCTTQRTTERYDRRDPYGRYDNPNVRDIPLEYKLERWQGELNLSNRQKRQIRDIQDRYERRGITRAERNNRREYRQLQQQKRRDLLSVLNNRQRNKLNQLERYDRRS
ncbi:hypothetical protein GCM10027347_20540 [Larkinella harenae]